jgi:flagellar motor switch protein FliM
MTNSTAHERSADVVSRISLANAAKRQDELQPIAPLFDLLAQTFGEILQAYAMGPVKCSVSSYGIETIEHVLLLSNQVTYEAAVGKLAISIQADRTFDGLLCEICFGGSGMSMEEVDGSMRPASRIETFLRNMVISSLHEKVPDLLFDFMAEKFVKRDGEPRTTRQSQPEQITCVKACLLVNVASISTEFEVLVPLSDVESLCGHSAARAFIDKRTFGAVLQDCRFELIAALPPHEVGLNEILNLTVGKLLKLSSSPNDPAHLSVEGINIGKGRINTTTDRISLVLQ